MNRGKMDFINTKARVLRAFVDAKLLY